MLVRILVGVAIVGFIVWIVRPRPEFRLRIREGRVALARGRVPHGFLSDCSRICADGGLASGTVSGVGAGQGIRLRFSRGIGPPLQQRFRNAWQVHAR